MGRIHIISTQEYVVPADYTLHRKTHLDGSEISSKWTGKIRRNAVELPTVCPVCHTKNKVVTDKTGTEMKFRCLMCGHRWRLFNG